MAPGRGFLQSAMLLASLTGITVAETESIKEEQLPRYKFRHSSTNQHSSEWIAGPNGYLYQFHIGEQSWLAAREFCLAENADLVSIRSKDQLDWILQHYAPIHPSFDERYVQIGLVSVSDDPLFSWVDGSEINPSFIEWATEPKEGNRCGLLRVNQKKVENINCDESGSTLHINRFICQRSTSVHQEQQRSNNYIWRKLESLLTYFGVSGEKEGVSHTKKDEEDDYWQAVETLTEEEKKIFIETAKNLTATVEPERTSVAEVEGSGVEEKSISEANSASREEKTIDENVIEKKDEGVNETPKKEEQNEVEETLTVLKDGKEEVKAETAILPERKQKREDDDELNKPLPLRELLDTEEGSGSSITENANIEVVPEDADLLASPTPSNEADIDKMIEKMEKLLDNLQGEKKEIGPIIIEKATPAPTATSTLIPIGPIIIEKAKEAIIDTKVEDSAKESLPEAESVEASKEKVDEKKEEVKKEDKDEKKKEEKEEEKKDLSEDEDSDLLGNLERTTLASTENKKSTDDEHKERLESDFTHENELEEMERLAEEVPTPKNELNEGNELDCDEKEGNVHLESSDGEKRELSEEQQKHLAEFLTLLRVFLKTARHDDLRSVIDDHSNMSLIERMKKAIAVAKERETEKQQLMSSMTPSEVEELEKKETASLMSDSEREQVYEEIKNAIKEGIMHDTLDVTTAAPEVIESTTEQSITTVSILEETTTVPTETTTVSIENPTTREGRVRIRIRTLAEVLEEERIEKERAEKEKERIRLSEEKISGAVEKEVKRERDSQIIPLRPLEDLEEINQNEITVATPSRLRFAGVKTFVIENEKKMIPVKDVDSISVLQSEELARKKKSDELRHKLEESLALRAAMRETVRRRNEQLKRKIEEERESYFLSGHRVKRDVYSEEEKKKRDQARNRILEKEEKELEKLRKRLAEVREENEKLEKDLDIVDEISTTTETPKKKTIKNAEKKVTRKPSTKTTTDFTTTRPLSAFEKKMDTNHLLNIISKMERERPTMIDRSAVSTMDRVFNNIGQEMHELLVG